jgi:hypothetical protein
MGNILGIFSDASKTIDSVDTIKRQAKVLKNAAKSATRVVTKDFSNPLKSITSRNSVKNFRSKKKK